MAPLSRHFDLGVRRLATCARELGLRRQCSFVAHSLFSVVRRARNQFVLAPPSVNVSPMMSNLADMHPHSCCGRKGAPAEVPSLKLGRGGWMKPQWQQQALPMLRPLALPQCHMSGSAPGLYAARHLPCVAHEAQSFPQLAARTCGSGFRRQPLSAVSPAASWRRQPISLGALRRRPGQLSHSGSSSPLHRQPGHCPSHSIGRAPAAIRRVAARALPPAEAATSAGSTAPVAAPPETESAAELDEEPEVDVRHILSDPDIEGDPLQFLKVTEAYWKVGSKP